MEAPNGAKARLPLLDGLRGLAAIFVMLFHVELAFGTPGAFSRSYLFVDFFFLLSGFVLTLSAEAKMNAGLGTYGFMRSRFIRFWPVVMLGALVGAIRHVGLHEPEMLALAAVMGVLLIPMLAHTGQLYPLNGPHWSLMLELLANLFHGLILRRMGDKALLILAAAFALVLAATIAQMGANNAGPFTFNWLGALPRVAFSYTLGVWMGRKWMTGSGPRRSPVSWRMGLTLPCAVLIVLAALPFRPAAGDTITVILLFPPLLWLAATATAPRRTEKWLTRLGAISFPLYAVHLPIIEVSTYFGEGIDARLLGIGFSLLAALWIAQITEGKRAFGRLAWPLSRRSPTG